MLIDPRVIKHRMRRLYCQQLSCVLCTENCLKGAPGAWRTAAWQRHLGTGAPKLGHAQCSGAVASRQTGSLPLPGSDTCSSIGRWVLTTINIPLTCPLRFWVPKKTDIAGTEVAYLPLLQATAKAWRAKHLLLQNCIMHMRHLRLASAFQTWQKWLVNQVRC
jgi:hypothetical protein